MSVVHLNHVRKKLEADFCPHIDMSDYVGKPAHEIEGAQLSRALAAFAVAEYAEGSPAAAATDVVDGFDDHGIDAIAIDKQNHVIVVVQSKWNADGKGSPALGDVEKFARGFNDLITPRFDRFNQKIQGKSADLTTALDNTDVRFELVLAHTGQQPLSSHAQEVVDDLLAQLNDVSDIVSFHHLGQSELHSLVKQGISGKAPDLAVTLHDWGMTQEPYRAFYGQVDATDVAEWWDQHRATLFDRNLRKFIHDSSVNADIRDTLVNEPAKFWYFNNGITVLCDRIDKAPAGGASRKSGKFAFEGATVVNGAQTVGSVGRAAAQDPAAVADARVHTRFISLEDCPPEFASDVTRATNTQNRVERRDFVALDSEQERLRTDLQLEQGKTYAIKTGEPDPPRSQGCTVVDATVALACAHSPELAVGQARDRAPVGGRDQGPVQAALQRRRNGNPPVECRGGASRRRRHPAGRAEGARRSGPLGCRSWQPADRPRGLQDPLAGRPRRPHRQLRQPARPSARPDPARARRGPRDRGARLPQQLPRQPVQERLALPGRHRQASGPRGRGDGRLRAHGD